MTVRNWLTSRGEKIVYISPDGLTYNLHDPTKRSVLEMRGWGLPAAQIADVRNPFQHGVTPVSIRVPLRTINVSIRHNAGNRDLYWQNRAEFVDILRLNRTNVNNPSPGALRWYRSDGTIRQVDCLVTSGPEFKSAAGRGGWDEFSYQDDLIFTAFNPVIYDPEQQSESLAGLSSVTTEQLTFPITFPIVFGEDVDSSQYGISIDYQGTWESFPLVIMYGPFDTMKVTHDQTGLILGLNQRIYSNESVIFDLSYNTKSVIYSALGTSYLGFVTEESSIGKFAIQPDPIVPSGVNSFTIEVTSGSSQTALSILYYNRYIGI